MCQQEFCKSSRECPGKGLPAVSAVILCHHQTKRVEALTPDAVPISAWRAYQDQYGDFCFFSCSLLKHLPNETGAIFMF